MHSDSARIGIHRQGALIDHDHDDDDDPYAPLALLLHIDNNIDRPHHVLFYTTIIHRQHHQPSLSTIQ